MLKLSLRSLQARTLRYLLASVAVILGVTFVVGSLVVTDSLRASFDALSDELAKGVDVQVRAHDPFDRAADLDTQRPPVPASLLPVVAGVDGVSRVSGHVEVPLTVTNPEGELVEAGAAPVLGLNWDGPDHNVGPFQLATGAPPTGDRVAVDLATAKAYDLAVGDVVSVRAAGATRPFTVAGLVRLDGHDSAGVAAFLFDTPTAQALAGAGDEFESISVAAAPGVSQSALAARVSAALPGGYEAVTGHQLSDEFAGTFAPFVSAFRWVLLVFGIVALLVSTFLVSNTFSIVLGQRVRELGMLRAIGCRQRQLVATVLGESLVIGLFGSVVGAVAGIGVGALLRWLMLSLSGDNLPGGLVVAPTTWLVALVVGTLVTTLSSLVPAWRAGRVPALTAMRDGAAVDSGRVLFTVRLVVSIVALAGGVLLLGLGLSGRAGGTGGDLAATGAGALATFVGVALGSVVLARPATRLLALRPFALGLVVLGGLAAVGALGAVAAGVATGRPAVIVAAALGGVALAGVAWLLVDTGLGGMTVAGRLARDNAARNPRRSTSTAAALMIGLALVCMASVVGQSLKSSIGAQVDEQLGADFILNTRTDQGTSPEFGRQLAARPELGAVAMVRQGLMRVGGETKQVSALPPGAAAGILRLHFTSGGYGTLADRGVIVQRDVARDLGLHVGDVVDAEFVQTGRVPLRVAGIYDHALGGLGNWMIATSTFEANFAPAEQRDLFGGASAAPGVDHEQARQAVESVAAAYPEVKVEDRSEFRRHQQQQVDQPLVAVNVLLAFALINALFGIANTMALSVLERTRELGLLRAVGMARRQVRRMVRWEAVLVSGFGAVLGVGLGLGFGLAVAHAMPDDIVSNVAVPVPLLGGVAVLAVLFGLLAAQLPARRASRLDVLQAIAVA